jgi:hypothetical protein
MKKYLLLMYYCIYKLLCWDTKINPVLYLYKLPFAKRHFARRNYDPTAAYMNAMTNPSYGMATIFAAILVGSSLSVLLAGVSGFFCGIFQINIDYKYQIFISFGSMFILCEFFLWRNDKEVKKEFKQFDKMSRGKKYMWLFITLIFIVIAIVIWWKGMVFWNKSIENF